MVKQRLDLTAQANTADSTNILTINSGSSSLKFSIYSMGTQENRLLSGEFTRIGLAEGHFYGKAEDGRLLAEESLPLPNHSDAFERLFGWLKAESGPGLDAVGHRLVHGGSGYVEPQIVVPTVLAALKELAPLAPDHMPHELSALEAAAATFPGLPQVACFDTAFHRHMPRLAQLYPLPRRLTEKGVIRYGFHGLSYEYVVAELAKERGAATGPTIIAHLGHGASMAAVRNGRSLDTTMGFTPTGGLMMSTRPGDLDPGVIFYLLEEEGLSIQLLKQMLNKDAGLKGVSGLSGDMRELLAQPERAEAAEAVSLFCYTARKYLGSLAAVLGGLETLVFTGGIGENSPRIRELICEGMAFLGINLERKLNDAGAPVISTKESPVDIRVIKTNEELMIARHTSRAIQQGEGEDEVGKPSPET